MPALLQILMSLLEMGGLTLGGIGARAGITRLLAKTALPKLVKSALPLAGEIGVFSSPMIYDALKAPRASDEMISSNHGNLAMLHEKLASPPPAPDNLQALMELMAKETTRGQGDELNGILQQQVI